MQPIALPILTFPEVALNLVLAMLLGAAIGFERQWRQRLAGLRTNTLVALGSAGFVVFSQLVPHEVSPTRVAAQVVSGIGFLGAGIIFKEGLNVRGLNTAATMWCSAAVGILAGLGAWDSAALLAGLVVGVNLLLRPLVHRINRQGEAGAGAEAPSSYAISVVCRGADKARVRAVLLQGLTAAGLHLRRLASADLEGTDRVEVTAGLWAAAQANDAVERTSAGSASTPPSPPRAGAAKRRWNDADALGRIPCCAGALRNCPMAPRP